MIRLAAACWLAGLLVQADATAQALQFRSHDPAAPAATVDGSIRGAAGDLSITLLAPPRLALAASPRPALYWHASAPINHPVEFVVVAEGGVEPLVEARIEPPLEAGVHRFELPESVHLEEGGYYQWSVAAVTDEQSRSNDVFASALLQRVAAPELATDADLQTRAAALALGGVWYDTLDLLATAAASVPRAAELRAALLTQAGLEPFVNTPWRISP